MSLSRASITRAFGVALFIALLALLLAPQIAASAQPTPHPTVPVAATRPTPPPSNVKGAASQSAFDTWLSQHRTQLMTPQMRARIAKLPKWKPNARIVTSHGVAPQVAHNALSPHLAVPVTTDPNNWTALGPGPVNINGTLVTGGASGLAVSATNPNDVWVTNYTSVWRSSDGGATWTQVPAVQSDWIVIDPTNDQTIYLDNPGVGLLRSTDGGSTWHSFASALATVSVAKLAIDPANAQHLLAAGGIYVNNVGPTAGGVWSSTDGGTTWTQTLVDSETAPNYPDQGTDVVYDATHSGVVYAALGYIYGYQAGSAAGGVYQSTDGGTTWTQLTGGPTGSQVGPMHLALTHDGARLYAEATVADTSSGNGLLNTALYVFTASSASWTSHSLVGTPVSQDYGQWEQFNLLATSPADASDQTVYMGSNYLYRSTDGGATWTEAWTNGVGVLMGMMAFPSASSGNFIVTTGLGVWSYTATSSAWTNENATLPVGDAEYASYGDQGSDSPLVAQYNGSAGIINGPGYANFYGPVQYPAGSMGLATWTPLPDPHLGSEPVTIDWSNNANVYVPYINCQSTCSSPQVYKSTTGAGGTFSPTGFSTTDAPPNSYPFPAVPEIAISQVHPQTLFFGTTRLWESKDGGATWNPISPQLDVPPPNPPVSCTGPSDTNCPTIATVEVAPTTDNTILVTYWDGSTYATSDGGATWYSVSYPCATAGCAVTSGNYVISSGNPQLFYTMGIIPTTSGGVTPHSGCGPCCTGCVGEVLDSSDGGHTWSVLPNSVGLPFGYGQDLAVSPANPNLLVLGAFGGVFISFDGGLNWMNIASLGPVDASSVTFSHDGSQLLLSTYENGVLAIAMPHLTLTPQLVSLTTAPGSSPANQTVTLGNSGQGALTWSASGLPSWLAVSPTSGSIAPGATASVTLSFATPSTTPQTYTTYLNFHTNADNPLTMLPVTVSSRFSKTWYFAEGFTGGSFSEYLTLANPNPTTAHVSVEYLLQNGSAPVTKAYTVGPNARQTVNVNSELGLGVGVSMVVTSDVPVVAERPMYFTYTSGGLRVPGGTDVLGATSLGTQFDFGYLDTTANHQTYLTVLNPTSSAMTVTATYLPAGGGAAIVVPHSVPANARGTILVNSDVPAGSYSAQISLSVAGLVERPMYLVDATTGDTGSADVIGVQAPATSWNFAEGFTGTGFSERYILSNPSTTSSASVTVTFQRADGTTAVHPLTLPAGQQQVVDANSVLGAGVNNSASVTSDQPILAERFMSFKYGGSIPGASDVMGATSVGTVYDFAEGYTGPSFSEYLTLQNPQNSLTQVTVAYLPQSGAAPTIQTYLLAPQSRFTVYTNQVMPAQSFSMEVLASAPIVAERPMYFAYGGAQTGGSDVLGYQP